MHLATAITLTLASVAAAVDMRPYSAGPGVEEQFDTFIEEYYLINEDKLANATFIDLWSPDAIMVLQGNAFHGPQAMLEVRNKLLPAHRFPSKDWWHLIHETIVVGEDETSKRYQATITVQTNYYPGNCSQAQ